MKAPAGKLFIEAVGLAAPGLSGWEEALPVLRGAREYAAAELPVYQPNLLPPNERRRASPTVRMAFRVAEEALRDSAIAANELATVFVSADGDLQISNRICIALAEPQRLISPTDFHNSVHNAAAGYWSIASGAQGPSTAISAWDGGFAAGLLEAAGMTHVEGFNTLLVAYDLPAPEPLLSKRPMPQVFGVALLLSARRSEKSLAQLQLAFGMETETILENASLETLRLSNPAARALPLLQAVACRDRRSLHFTGSHSGTLQVTVSAA